jgi:hypothetical protein
MGVVPRLPSFVFLGLLLSFQLFISGNFSLPVFLLLLLIEWRCDLHLSTRQAGLHEASDTLPTRDTLDAVMPRVIARKLEREHLAVMLTREFTGGLLPR